MTTDAKHVENLAGLPEDRSLTQSSRVIDCGQRDVTELSTAAQAVMSRKGTGAVSCFGPSELAHRQDYEAKRVHRHHSASKRETHAGGELVQSPGGDLHGPGSSPSHDEQAWSAD